MEDDTYQIPRKMTQRDWNAVMGYLLATLNEVQDPAYKRPESYTSFFWPDYIKKLYYWAPFDVVRYYAKDIEKICLTTGLQPDEFRDLFNSACVGRLERFDQKAPYNRILPAYGFNGSHVAKDTVLEQLKHASKPEGADFVEHLEWLDEVKGVEGRLHNFRGPHLSDNSALKLMRHSGQPDWQSFVDHYATTTLEEGGLGGLYLKGVPKHDPRAVSSFPTVIENVGEYRDEVTIRVTDDKRSPSKRRFSVFIHPRDHEEVAQQTITFTATIENREVQNQMMNRLVLALENSLIYGVAKGANAVQAIADEFGIERQKPVSKDKEPSVQKEPRFENITNVTVGFGANQGPGTEDDAPARRVRSSVKDGKGVPSTEKDGDEKIVRKRKPRFKRATESAEEQWCADPAVQAAALAYWKQHFVQDQRAYDVYDKLQKGATFEIRACERAKKGSPALVKGALAYYMVQHPGLEMATAQAAFMEQYGAVKSVDIAKR